MFWCSIFKSGQGREGFLFYLRTCCRLSLNRNKENITDLLHIRCLSIIRSLWKYYASHLPPPPPSSPLAPLLPVRNSKSPCMQRARSLQHNLVPRALWVFFKMAGHLEWPAILKNTQKALGTRLLATQSSSTGTWVRVSNKMATSLACRLVRPSVGCFCRFAYRTPALYHTETRLSVVGKKGKDLEIVKEGETVSKIVKCSDSSRENRMRMLSSFGVL